MVMPKSLTAYGECEEYFEKALAADKGIAVLLPTEKDVHRFRLKMNTYRSKLRRQAKLLYPEGDPRHGTTPYDKFVLTIDPDNPLRVLVRVHEVKVTSVETL